MPDAHIIILGCLNEMAGNATTGRIYELIQAVTALHGVITESQPPPQGSTELMEEIEAWACTGGSFELGASEQAKDFIERCNGYL